MKIHTIGSSSKGNGYVIETTNSALILECGVPLNDILKVIDFNIEKVVCGLVSHSHGDHSKYITQFLKRGIKIFNNVYPHHNSIAIKHRELITIKDFKIMPLTMKHDVECFGFVIYHKEFGSLLFVTDTNEIPYKLEVNHLLIEANYSTEILDNKQLDNKIHGFLAKRIEDSHLSYEKCCNWIQNNKSKLEDIILLHLSDSNSSAEMFYTKLEKQTGIPVWVAEAGETISIM